MLGGIIGVCAGFLAVLAARLLANGEFKFPRFNAKDKEQPSENNDRARVVEHCQRCAHREFDPKRGLICKLTDNYGDFQNKCQKFYLDDAYFVKQYITEQHITEYEQQDILSKHAIQSVLFHWGYTILEDDEPHNGRFDTIRFENNECKFVLAFDLPIVMINCIFGVKMDIRLARAIAAEVAESFVVVKIYVSKSFNNNGVADVRFAIETLVQYTDEFRVQFPQYMDILAEARQRFGSLLEKYGTYDSLRRRNIYDKEYHEIPAIVDGVTDGNINPEALWDDESGLRGYLRRDCAPSMQAEWDAFRILRVDNYGDYKLIIYQFPEPKEVPEALYGVVLLDTKTHRAEYYTLEYSYNGKWVYGSTSRGKHFNYGEVDSPDLELFVAWIFSSDKKLLHYTDLSSNDNETVN